MLNFKTSEKIFKKQISTQTDNYNLRKNDATDKKHILRKMGLKFRNINFDVLSKMAL